MDIKTGIVAVLNPAGEIVGTGFLCAPQLILTCAHVIDLARSAPGAEVSVRFEVNQTHYVATVSEYSPPDVLDIAVLRLERAPRIAQLLPLGQTSACAGHRFLTFGYPRLTDIKGLWARGDILGNVKNADAKSYLQISSSAVAPGMSGGPLWDENLQVVVGMVVSGLNYSADKRLRDESFAIPVETLLKFCPEIKTTVSNPYRSLECFAEADADYFFGREKLSAELLNKLRGNMSMLAVVGASGSGKSSVVQAGLLPLLRAGKILGSEKWGILLSRPGNSPFASLVNAGLLNAGNDLAGAARQWLAENPNASRLVLLIDQFEEIFTQCEEETRKKFAAQLAETFHQCPDFTLIITMRDEFLPKFNREMIPLLPHFNPGLWNLGLDISDDELIQIVEKPAGLTRVSFEPGLAQKILDDLKAAGANTDGGRATLLPLLEFTLTQLWEKRSEGQQISLQSYKELGGVSGSIPLWADRTFQKLDDQQKKLARRILTDLVQLGKEELKVPDTRQRLSVDRFIRNEKERDAVRAIVDEFSNQHLLVTTHGGVHDAEMVEIIHEALLKEWQPFAAWLKEDRTFLNWYRPFQARRDRWLANAQDPGLLLGGADLREAVDWLSHKTDALSGPDRDFITNSQKEAARLKRGQRTLRTIQYAVLVLMALCVVLVLLVDKTWYRFVEFSPARSALETVRVRFEGLASISAPDADALRSAASKSYVERVQAVEHSPNAAEMLVKISPVQPPNQINLTITLPGTYAHHLDFLPEIRTLGPEDMSSDEAASVISAAAAYSVGKYEDIEEILRLSKSLSANKLRAQAFLYLDKFAASSAAYTAAIQQAAQRGQDASQLHMGAALARWRPNLSEEYTDKKYSQAELCSQAFTDQYEKVIPQAPEDYWIIQSASLLCSRTGWKDNWPGTLPIPKITDAISYRYFALALQSDWNAKDQRTFINDNLTLAANDILFAYRELYMLSFNKFDCDPALNALRKYKEKSFTKLDRSIIRYYLKSSLCFSFIY